MPKHYSNKKSSGKSMAMPRDAATGGNMNNETQLYHMGKSYYGKGYGEFANLPKEPDYEQYPKARKYLDTEHYPDTIREIDTDNDFNYGKVASHMSDSMY